MIIRQELEKREEMLHPLASKSIHAARLKAEKKSPVRTEFQRDRDRILHCKSFRRLKHKTQVFISPEGDHFRTRLTHTLEVSQIARTIAKALNLNEDLTEAIALGHDLGHTPFGHMGERVLNDIFSFGFHHYEQSLRVVSKLENNGAGLNLTTATMDGILKHSKGSGPVIPENKDLLPYTLEGQIVRLADIIAYVNHDIDDAIRARIITNRDIPDSVRKQLGDSFAKRIDTIVINVINETLNEKLQYISISSQIYNEILNCRQFLFDKVYWRQSSYMDQFKVNKILTTVYEFIGKDPKKYIHSFPESDNIERRSMDFIAGMTDRYALNIFKSITFPLYS
jgi:dGTPase